MLETIIHFLDAFTLNLRIGSASLLIGVVLGLGSAALRFKRITMISRFIGFIIGLLRAFPVYVFMFVAFNYLVSSIAFDSLSLSQTSEIAVILAISVYTIPACSDAFLSFLLNRFQGKHEQSWLIFPNLMQVYVISVMSSSVGAALGLQEAVTFTLSLAETLPTREQRILLVFVVMLFFASIMASTRWIVLRLSRNKNSNPL